MFDQSKMNLVGEEHDESKKNRAREEEFCRELLRVPAGEPCYWTESSFTFTPEGGSSEVHGDDYSLRAMSEMVGGIDGLSDQLDGIRNFRSFISDLRPQDGAEIAKWTGRFQDLCLGAAGSLSRALVQCRIYVGEADVSESVKRQLRDFATAMAPVMDNLRGSMAAGGDLKRRHSAVTTLLGRVNANLGRVLVAIQEALREADLVGGLPDDLALQDAIDRIRSFNMAASAFRSDKSGVWKIGEDHYTDLTREPQPRYVSQGIVLVSRATFQDEFRKWAAEKGYVLDTT